MLASRAVRKQPLRVLAEAIGVRPLAPECGAYTRTMREDAGTREAMDALGLEPRRGPRLHVGWGSFRNLDVVVARRSSQALVCDINVHQLNLWRAVEAALARSRTADAFVDALAGSIPEGPPLRQFHTDTRAWLRGDLDRAESWLHHYDFVREMFSRGDVAFACVDARDAGALARLGTADTIYVSNLPYALREPRGFFGEPHGDGCPVARMWAGLARVADERTWIVKAERLVPGASPDDPWWVTEIARAG